MKLFVTILGFLSVTGACQAGIIIDVNNIDLNDGAYSNFAGTLVGGDPNTLSLTRTFDFDSGGTDDTLTFTLVRTTYGAGTITNGTDVAVGAVNNGGNINNWYSHFDSNESIQFEVQNISYTSGEANGNTAVFNGFQGISRINFTSGGVSSAGASIDYLVHTGPVGSTTVTNAGGLIDLTSAGNASSVFLTAPDGALHIRARDLDLQFCIIPEPSSVFLLGFAACLLLMLRCRRSRLPC